MSGSNCCFCTCKKVSQEAVRVVWYPIPLRIFHSWLWSTQSKTLRSQWSRSRCFPGISCIFYDPMVIGNLISGSSAFSKSSLNIWKHSQWAAASERSCSQRFRAPYWIIPGGSEVKVSAGNTRDLGSILGSERCPEEGNGSPLQYSCLENPMDRGVWRATVHRVAKGCTWLSD